MKKGISKPVVEIFGGIIAVVILLLVIVYFSSTVSASVEDAKAYSSFHSFKSALSSASEDGNAAISNFELSSTAKNRYYAITYIPYTTHQCLLGELDTSHSSGDKCCFPTDVQGERSLRKCYAPGSNVNDVCMCVIRFDPNEPHFEEENKYLQNYNILGLSYNPVGFHNPQSDVNAIKNTWCNIITAAFDPQLYTNPNINTRVKVLDCAMVMEDIGCSYFYENINLEVPCMLNYKSNSNNFRLFWIMGGRKQAFLGGKIPLETEILEFRRDSSYPHIIHIEPSPDIASGNRRLSPTTWTCDKSSYNYIC